jgi:hypothetical protein
VGLPSTRGHVCRFSPEHSSLVPLVLKPQYHVVFDDKFETVPPKNISDKHIDDKFAELYKSSADIYLDLIDDDDDDVSLPYLSSKWEVTHSTTAPDGAPEGASEGVYDIFDFHDDD